MTRLSSWPADLHAAAAQAGAPVSHGLNLNPAAPHKLSHPPSLPRLARLFSEDIHLSTYFLCTCTIHTSDLREH